MASSHWQRDVSTVASLCQKGSEEPDPPLPSCIVSCSSAPRVLGDGRSAHRMPRRALVQEEASVLYILHREASGWAVSAADALCHQ